VDIWILEGVGDPLTEILYAIHRNFIMRRDFCLPMRSYIYLRALTYWHDTMLYIYVGSKADERASLI